MSGTPLPLNHPPPIHAPALLSDDKEDVVSGNKNPSVDYRKLIRQNLPNDWRQNEVVPANHVR